MSEFLSLQEVTEHSSEIYYLLYFFSQSQNEQWNQVPDDFTPCWVDVHHCNAETPILFLALVFSGIFGVMYPYPYKFSDEFLDFINCEIFGLLDSWMIDSGCYEYVFTKRPENSEHGHFGADRIWVVLSRLCKIALNYDDWEKYSIKQLSFEHFVEKYATDYDPL
jgi:hypothetical protein